MLISNLSSHLLNPLSPRELPFPLRQRRWGFAGSRFPELSPGGKLTKLRFRQLAPGHQNAPRPPYHTQLTRAPHASHRGTSTRTYPACLSPVWHEVASVRAYTDRCRPRESWAFSGLFCFWSVHAVAYHAFAAPAAASPTRRRVWHKV